MLKKKSFKTKLEAEKKHRLPFSFAIHVILRKDVHIFGLSLSSEERESMRGMADQDIKRETGSRRRRRKKKKRAEKREKSGFLFVER